VVRHLRENRRKRAPLPALVGLLIALAGAAPAQETRAETRPDTRPDDFVYRIPPEGISLETLAHEAEQATGRTFILSEKSPLKNKTIRLFGEARVPKDQAYSLFQALFVTQGYALKPLGDASGRIMVVDSIDTALDLKQHAVFVPREELPAWRNDLGTIVMTFFPLRHVQLQNVRAAISQLLTSKSAEIALDVESANALIVFGFAPTVFAIKQVVEAMDVPQPEQELRFERIDLKIAVAEEVEPIISNLIEANARGGGFPQVPGQQERSRQGVVPTAFERPAPKLVVDPRTNAIAVYAVSADIAEIRRLVAILDQEIGTPAENLHFVHLNHVNAEDLADTLREILGISGGGGRGSSGQDGGGRGAAGRSSAGSSSIQDVQIVADERTNALIVRASKTQYLTVRSLIAELDRRRPQVIIQAVVAELTNEQFKQIGTEIAAFEGGSGNRLGAVTGFGLSQLRLHTTSSLSGSGPGSGTGTGGGQGGGSANLITRNSISRLPTFPGNPLANPGGIFGIFNENLNVPLLISLLQSKTCGNLLSAPVVLANDQTTSLIEAARLIPFTQFTEGSGVAPAGAEGGRESTLSAPNADETGFGGYQEAKISLKVSPHISNDDYVRLELEILVERFLDETRRQTGVGTESRGTDSQPATRPVGSSVPPDKTSRSLAGSVTLRNGATVVVGGLVLDRDDSDRGQVPYVGDSPLLAPLFGVTGKSRERATVYFFLTPTILKTFDQLDHVSYEKKLEIRKLQGPVKLIDPDFRPILLDDRWIAIDGIEGSGYLDIPRYVAIVPLQECGPAPEDAPSPPR
jgi:general secretion pathway protein D